MGWLFGGVLYSTAYVLIGWQLGDHPQVLSWYSKIACMAVPYYPTRRPPQM